MDEIAAAPCEGGACTEGFPITMSFSNETDRRAHIEMIQLQGTCQKKMESITFRYVIDRQYNMLMTRRMA